MNTAASGVSSFYDIKESDAAGAEVDFARFKGKVAFR